jgi:4-hydroxy-4-methyl-2-oxoglutarate aldolase
VSPLDDDRPHPALILRTVSTIGDLALRFSSLYTGALTDVLDRHGHLQQTLPAELAPLELGTRLAGPVYPVLGRPHPGHDYDTSIRLVLEMLGSVPPGHVAVYATNDRASAHFGELSATSLASRGCAGAVIDGGTRDVDYIVREGFPVFARYETPQDCVPRWEVLAHGDVTIVVGGVRVAPGDWIVGDRDGLVVVPGASVEDVLAEAEAKVATENEIRDSVRNGMLPLAAYEQYGTF